MKKTWKRMCTGFLALATVVTALPTTLVHAESKQYRTESKEHVGIVEKVMNLRLIQKLIKIHLLYLKIHRVMKLFRSMHQRVSKRLLLVHLTLKTAVTVCLLHHRQVRITAFLLKQNSVQIIRSQSAVRVYLMLIRL